MNYEEVESYFLRKKINLYLFIKLIISLSQNCNFFLNYFFRYKNYHPDALVEIVAKLLALVPPWVRVYRI